MPVALELSACPVVELRRYRLRRGATRQLLDVFERRLVEAQEQAGMTVAGTFLDEGDADAFVWMRGFAGHRLRTEALTAFYDGPVWARNAETANATMIDSDDVLLLRPTVPARPSAPAVDRGDALDAPRPDRLVAEILSVPDGHSGDDVEAWFSDECVTGLDEALGTVVSAWRTDSTPNGFPRLPVRTDRAVVWLASFADAATRAEALSRLDTARVDREIGTRVLRRRRLLLSPTSRSAHPRSAHPRSARSRSVPATVR